MPTWNLLRVDTVAIMIRVAWRWSGVCILLLAWTHAAVALDPQRSLEHFGHQAWRTDSGLPQNTVHAILQTRDGFLWLGTDGGLVRFDGIDFVTFDAENTPAFKSDTVNHLLQDESGALWISTASGLLRYQGGAFTAYGAAQGLPADTVWFSHQDKRHRLWAITAAGPAWFNGKSFTALAGAQSAGPMHPHAMVEDEHGTLWLGGSSGVLAVDTTPATPRAGLRLLDGVPVETVELDGKGALWIGTGQGLQRYAQDVLVPVLHLPGKTEVTSLYPDPEDGMWVGTATGILHLAKDGTRVALEEKGLGRVDGLYRDREHVLWVATESGVFRVKGDRLQAFAPGSPLAVNRVLSMYEDREGDLWMGTDSGGLHVLRDQKFTTYTTADGLSGNLVRCVFASAKGELWIGTDGAGLNQRTGSGFAHYSTADGLSSNVILSLAGGAGDDLWVGTPNGLNLLHQGKVKRFTSADGLPDDFIRSLYADRDGSLWIGTRHGLAHLSGDKFTTFSSMDGLGSDFIGAILRSRSTSLSDPLWIGTSAGLSRLENGVFTNTTVEQGLSNNTVTAIEQDTQGKDTQGTLWLGTNGGGLNRLTGGGKIQALPWSSQGLPGTIYGMLEDAAGHLWLSSKTGIFRVSIHALNQYLSGAAHAIAVEAYGTADGMNIRECSGGGHPAAWKLADGSLWFATLDGVSFIDPEHAPENRVPPPVEIEKVLVDDQVRSLQGELTIKPGANRLEFRYAGLSFVAPQKVEYRYQLEGFDHGWIEAGTRRAAFYTNLPPGSYRFRVLAANNDGVWNTAGASFGLRLMPHYYQTWWFYSALALALLVLGYLVYRWRVLAVEAQWAAVLRERGRIAREIHDTLAQGFVGVSVQLELVARLLAGSGGAAPKIEPVVEQLDQARALVRASLADARTSIWDLRSGAAGGPNPSSPNPSSIDQPEDLPSRLRRSCTRLAGGSSTKVYLQVKGTYRPVSPKIEEELLRIGQEAVANAIRHASATRIDVQLVYEAARVSLRVEDDGRGFTPVVGTDGPEGHYGIRGMRERAGEIDAALWLESTVGEGTRVSVEAPLA